MTSFQNDPQRDNGIWLKAVRYLSSGLHAVDGADADGHYYIDYSIPTTGSLLIERSNDDFSVRYLNGPTWQTLFNTQHDFVQRSFTRTCSRATPTRIPHGKSGWTTFVSAARLLSPNRQR